MNAERTGRFGNKRPVMPNPLFQSPQTGVRRKATGNAPADGFTLLEILTAVFIFAIILTTVFGSYRFVFGHADRLTDDITLHEMAQTSMDRISRDLSALYVHQPPTYRKPTSNDPPDPFRFFAREDDIDGQSAGFLRFTSLAHLPQENDSRDGIAEITYYVQQSAARRWVLRRSDRLWPYPPFGKDPRDPVLCEYVRSLRFVFLKPDGTPFNEWNSDDTDFDYGTPSAVTIRLELENRGSVVVMETTVVPPVQRTALD